MSEPVSAERATYGNFSDPHRKGLWGTPWWVTFAGLLLIMVVLFAFVFAHLVGGLIATGLAVILFGPALLPPVQGRNFYTRRVHRMLFKRAERQGRTTYVAGPAGRTPDGSFRLPGLAASSSLLSATDSYGEPMGVIHFPAAKHYTVVLDVYPTGNALVDQSTIDSQVGQWGGWLAHLGTEPRIAGASVTVETAPDPGIRLANAVESNITDDAPAFARVVASEIVDTYGNSAPAIMTRVALTFTAKSIVREEKPLSTDEMLSEMRTLLPTLMDGLRTTGAGQHVSLCSAQDITDFTRTAFDPSVATLIEQERRSGHGTGLTWRDAGPSFARHYWDYYQHDRAFSLSWTMASGPRGVIYDTSLKNLLAPSSGIARKRVTLLYRPEAAGKTADIAQSAVNNANFVASQGHRASARLRVAQSAAAKAEMEEAAGAGFVRMGMIVTATVLSLEDLPRTKQMIASQSSHTKLKLRPALGNQDTAFVAGLPLGIVLPQYMAVPAELMDAL